MMATSALRARISAASVIHGSFMKLADPTYVGRS
jgi:hypothetical protein